MTEKSSIRRRKERGMYAVITLRNKGYEDIHEPAKARIAALKLKVECLHSIRVVPWSVASSLVYRDGGAIFIIGQYGQTWRMLWN